METVENLNDEEFGAALEAHRSKLNRLVLSWCYRRPDDVEDIVQVTMLRAWMHRNTFRAEAQFSSWLTRIAFNAVMDYGRKSRVRGYGKMDQINEDIDIPDPRCLPMEDQIEESRQQAVLYREVEKLAPKMRGTLRLALSDNLPIRVSNTEKTRLFRAKHIIRQKLTKSIRISLSN